jgi:hypothetical protein
MSTAGQRRALGKKGRILEALRRSPLVGADLDLGRPRENRRMCTMADRALPFDPPGAECGEHRGPEGGPALRPRHGRQRR